MNKTRRLRKFTRRHALRPALVMATCLGAWTPSAFAQQALRDSIAGERVAEARRRAFENTPANLEAGPVRFLVKPALELEFNDNINIVERGAQQDLIVRPQVDFRAAWQVTDKNRLDFSVNAGYAKYTSHSEYDHALIRPGSELSFDIFVGDWRLNLHERFSYIQDPRLQGAVSGVAQFGGLSNAAGLAGDWDLKDLLLTFGYDHVNFFSATERFNYLDRSSEQLFTRASLQPQPEITTGFEASGSLTSYDRPLLNDNSSFSAGAFIKWQVSTALSAEGRAGYTRYLFDGQGTTGTESERGAYFFSARLAHQINERVSHALEGGREIDLGINSNLLDLWSVRHRAQFRVIRHIDLATEAFYERGQEPLFTKDATFSRVGAGLTLTAHWMRKITTSLAYRFLDKTASLEMQDYTQHSVVLGASYHF